MATRLALHDVGSSQWIINEVSEAHRREADHLEDFTIAVRNELEWLNEHMSDLFSQDTDFGIQNEASSPTHTPAGTHVAVFPCAAKPLVQSSKPVDYNTKSGTSTPDLIRDSGAWTGSSGSRSLAGSFATIPDEPVERCSPAKKPSYQQAPDITAETAERRTFSDATRGSYTSAQEELVGDNQVAPTLNLSSEIKNSNGDQVVLTEGHASRNSTDRYDTHIITSSVRLVEEVCLEAEPRVVASRLTRKEPSETPDNRPPDFLETTHRPSSVSPIQTSSPPPQIPTSPISPIRQQDHESIRTPKTLVNEQGGESETPSEAASPAGVSRGSMNFASLPARETLTHKKSMGGINTAGSRNSQADDRMSFFGRLTGGKSLGASSITGETGLQDSTTTLGMMPAQASSNNLSDEEDDDYDLNEQLRLAEINKASVMQLSEKTSTQRLNEKISQLSQQGTNRLSKSKSNSSLSSSIQSEDCSVSKIAGAADSTPSDALSVVNTRESIQSDEGDWVSSHPQVAKTKVINISAASPSPAGPNWRTANEDAVSTPMKNTATSTHTKLPLPISAIKKIEGNIAYPTLPAGARINDAITPLGTKLSSDAEVTTAKKNQANIFSFAKQLLWRSGRSESPKPSPSKSSSKPVSDEGPITQVPTVAGEEIHIANRLYPEIKSPVLHESLSRVFSKVSDQLQGSQVGTHESHQEGGLVAYGDILKREVQLQGPSPAVIDGINLIPENVDDLVRSPEISDNEPSLPGSPFSDIATAFNEIDEKGHIICESSAPRLGTSNLENSSPQLTKSTPAMSLNAQESTFQKHTHSKGTELKKPNRGIFGVKDSGISKSKMLPQNPRLVPTLQREIDTHRVSFP
ncbi:hypothetical protein AA313_de0200430 [Arthrobotrys entomopaga]|nr:hypothetical protein AA313_de0200430 [Arthrobotrys entomopaga]